MNPQSWAAVAALIVAFVGSVLYQTHHIDKRFDLLEKRLDALERSIDRRFEDFKLWIQAEVKRLEERIEHMSEGAKK